MPQEAWYERLPPQVKLEVIGAKQAGTSEPSAYDADFIMAQGKRCPKRCRWQVEFRSEDGLHRASLEATPNADGTLFLRVKLEGQVEGPAWSNPSVASLSAKVQLVFDAADGETPSAGTDWPRTVPLTPFFDPVPPHGHYISPEPLAAEMALMEAGSGSSGGSCPDRPTCSDHENGLLQSGWSHWVIPQGGDKGWDYDTTNDIVTTPTTTQGNEWDDPVKNHVVTNRAYPDGFILEIEFSFDPKQLPIFPAGAAALAANKHRSTFLGNSGIGIYHWTGNEKGKYLYEVQITDVAGMMGGGRIILHENRFVRLNYGTDWKQRGVLADIMPAEILTNEKTHLDPRLYPDFRNAIENGGADCLCAIVAGLPVSYFEDVYLTGGGEEFPKTSIAVSSPIPLGPNNPNPLPIGGIENPLDMYWGHRGDYVAGDAGGYKHFNKLNSGDWNTLTVCFLPARYDTDGNKCKNAYLRTEVNKNETFGGGFDSEIKSGTRSSRHTQANDPEPAVYKDGNGDMKIRLLGHWGSTVKYRNVKIRSVGSEG